MTPEQISWLTWGAVRQRPHGAPKWDEPGTRVLIEKHCGTWAFEVATEHVLAHARDPKARTPAAIRGAAPSSTTTGMPMRSPISSNCAGAMATKRARRAMAIDSTISVLPMPCLPQVSYS